MNKFRFDEKLSAFTAIKNELPTKLGNIAVTHFKDSFRNQGFTDNSFSHWKPRKKPDAGRAILVKSGDLRRSVKIKRKNSSQVVIGSDLVYAAVHNFGTAKMPKREYVGNSHQLTRKCKAQILKDIKKVFK